MNKAQAQLNFTSKEKAEILLRAVVSKKAAKPVLIRLDGLTVLTDYFLIVSARSQKHVTAVAEAVIEDARKRKIVRYSAEGVHQGHWALLDYGDVIVHVFHQPIREFYDLEGLWAEAPREAIPDDILASYAGTTTETRGRSVIPGHFPRTSQTSAAGLSVTSPRYSGCGAPTTRRSDLASTSSSGSRSGSTVTCGSVQKDRVGLEAQDALELVRQA